jgi:peptide/nickel transport system permease protein
VLRFVVRRILLMIPVLFGLTVLLFIWVRALPGDPARALLGEKATPAAIASVNEQYGFDEPLIQQFRSTPRSCCRGTSGTRHGPVSRCWRRSSNGSRRPWSWRSRR